MSRPTAPKAFVPLSLPPKLPTTPPCATTPRFLITTKADGIQTFDTSHPIHRFDFPSAAAQASFHHAFHLLHTQKEKAEFMSHYFNNYDGQVSIPKIRSRYDTTGDDALAAKLQAETPLSLLDTSNDIMLARQLQQEAKPHVDGDEDIARMLQGDTPLPDTSSDMLLAQRLGGESRQQAVVERDAERARQMNEEKNCARSNYHPQGRGGGMWGLEEDFGFLTFADRRRPRGEHWGAGPRDQGSSEAYHWGVDCGMQNSRIAGRPHGQTGWDNGEWVPLHGWYCP